MLDSPKSTSLALHIPSSSMLRTYSTCQADPMSIARTANDGNDALASFDVVVYYAVLVAPIYC
jgi:hypothetical protein